MADNKPEITATIKFRGVTIEGMTVQELKELRDVLNTLVGEPQRVVERVVERHDHIYPYRAYPYTTPIWAVSQTRADNVISLGNSAPTNAQHFTLTCQN